jgi:hypothetical protein
LRDSIRSSDWQGTRFRATRARSSRRFRSTRNDQRCPNKHRKAPRERGFFTLPDVHRLYFEPEHDEFRPRTFYSLSNAFTSAFKTLEPVRLMEATAKLAPFLAQYPHPHATLSSPLAASV